MWSLISIKDIIDIILLASVLYGLYRMMRRTGSINAFLGILAVVGLWVIVRQVLQLRLMGTLMDKFMSIGALVIVILFQDEIKRFLIRLGSHKYWRMMFSTFSSKAEAGSPETTMSIVLACRNMAKGKVGALIVIEQTTDLRHYTVNGERIEARINTRLIENVFFKNSPLHDGAMIIAKNRIATVGAILPVAHNSDIPKEMGLRHRAALGISQITDARVIVVSEERGKISFVQRGEIRTNISDQELEELLNE